MQAEEAEALARAARGERTARNAGQSHAGAEAGTATGEQTKSEDRTLMERVVDRSNMQLAYRRVVANKGAAGVDAMAVTELKDWLKENWPSAKKALLEGRYLPQAVRRVDIPKPQGGVRTLGVPTVVDRLIQQALHQVLSPGFETGFHERSYGFRPGRSAQQAVQQAQQYVRMGRRWVVDLDIEDLDVWVRRHLRRLLWKQWQRPTTRERRLRQLGLAPARAWRSSVNGRGPWWNAGARHMVAALPPAYFTRMGLVSLVATHRTLPSVA